MTSNNNNMRKNGLASPYNVMQIGTWLLLPCIVLQFIIFITPTIPSKIASVFVTLLFLGSACSSIYYAYMTSATDPIDPRLHSLLKDKQRSSVDNNNNIHENIDQDIANDNICMQCITPPSVSSRLRVLEQGTLTTQEEEEATKFCWVCQARVGCTSMHCKFCNKCVSNFDHHCQWLNTCIGDANYTYFTKCVASLCVMSYLHVFCSIAVLVSHFNVVDENSWWFSSSNNMIWIIFTILFLILNIGVALLITQLLLFHLQLYNKQITTYEYILQDNAKRRDKERFMIALDNKRKLELRDDNHDAFYKLRLHLGSFPICKCIDPLQQQQHHQQSSSTKKKQQKDSKKCKSSSAISNHTTTTPSIEESKSTESQKLTNNMHTNTNNNGNHHIDEHNNGGGVLLSKNNNTLTNTKSSRQIESLDVIVPNTNNTTSATNSIEISVDNSNSTSSHV